MTRKPTQQDSSDQVQRRLIEAEAQLEVTHEAMTAARGDYSEQVLTKDPKRESAAYERIAQLQREETRQQAAIAALQRHLSAAREREEAEARNERWGALESALERRHAAFARAEELVKPFAVAVSKALDCEVAVWAAAPIAYGRPAGAGLRPFEKTFEWLNNLRQEEVPVVCRALADLEAKSREEGARLLSLRDPQPRDAAA